MLQIRKAIETDKDTIWGILQEIILEGTSFAYPSNSTKEEILSYWFADDKHTFVAEENGIVVASFILKDNQPGRGSHIANAAYAVSAKHAGKGIGHQIGEQSLHIARALGYRAMQFNIVVKTNERAVKLWQKVGFQIIGEIPEAFLHPTLGYVNAYIMYQKL